MLEEKMMPEWMVVFSYIIAVVLLQVILFFLLVIVCGCLLQAEMERALLQGERQAELDQIEAETDIITQLQCKLDELESAIQREKDKVEKAGKRVWGYYICYIQASIYKGFIHTLFHADTHCLTCKSIL